jgi:hypothetical protein
VSDMTDERLRGAAAIMLLVQAQDLLLAHDGPPSWLPEEDQLRWSQKYGDWLRSTGAVLDAELEAALAAKGKP